MRNILLSVLAGALAFWSVQASAQDAEIIADLRCVIVGMGASEMPDPNVHSAGMMLTIYYLGRLDARVPKLDIEEPMIKEISKMTPADYKSEAQRCGASLTTKGQQITRIGQDMVQRGLKGLGGPATRNNP